MTDEKLVEVVARAIMHEALGNDTQDDWENWEPEARAAIAAYEAAKGGAPAGWVMVPREPTPEMVAAGEKGWMRRDLTRDDSAPIPDCYRAMLAAARSALSDIRKARE